MGHCKVRWFSCIYNESLISYHQLQWCKWLTDPCCQDNFRFFFSGQILVHIWMKCSKQSKPLDLIRGRGHIPYCSHSRTINCVYGMTSSVYIALCGLKTVNDWKRSCLWDLINSKKRSWMTLVDTNGGSKKKEDYTFILVTEWLDAFLSSKQLYLYLSRCMLQNSSDQQLFHVFSNQHPKN